MLEEKTQKIEGAMIEDNRFCISVHFRRVHEKVIELHIMKSLFPLSIYLFFNYIIINIRKFISIYINYV